MFDPISCLVLALTVALCYFAEQEPLQVGKLIEDWERGRRGRAYSLLAAGAVCGILWEFWNYWAFAKWIYIFPILQSWKIFEMPAPGFLGFPPFALETYLMYCFCVRLGGHVPDL